MKKSKVFEECQTIADSLGFKVIHGKGNFNGDICRFDDNKIIVLNKNKTIEQRIKRFLCAVSNERLFEPPSNLHHTLTS